MNSYVDKAGSYSALKYPQKVGRVNIADNFGSIRSGIWVYLILLIFEGALRKWVLPGLAGPLLIIRDPVAIWILFMAWQQDIFPSNKFVNVIAGVCVLSLITTMVIGHGNIVVAIYGARILLIHFPLIFVISRVLTRKDILEFGKILMWISIPMTILMGLQFYTPQSSLVNRSVGGGAEGAGFSGALGYFRPSGTFSFTNGLSLFYNLVGCYVVYFWVRTGKVNTVLLIAATFALIISIPLSISRLLLFQLVLTLAFAVSYIVRKPQNIGKAVFIAVVGFAAMALVSNLSFFQTATDALSARLDNAADSEGGLRGTLVDRFLGGLASAIQDTGETPFFGFGLGMGTNAGAQLVKGDRAFLISEGEWGRLVGEMGLALGLTAIIVRLLLCFRMLVKSFKILKTDDLLPWLFVSFSLLLVGQGQWAQPTNLGFSTFVGGITIAAIRTGGKQA